ncbi:MAG: hypothetical protein K6G26_01425 [Lachnospiraceae bacterium]|nr:hypothetical protein [Lachnospiraceae bacterium]
MIYILPDRLVVRGRKGWGVVEYSELHILFGEQPFVEYGVVPKDTKVIGKTWQYVNKDGGPDKRYNNNRQLPKCVYGHISFKSDTGLDIIINVSDIDKAMQFKKIILQIIEESEEMKKNEVTKS